MSRLAGKIRKRLYYIGCGGLILVLITLYLFYRNYQRNLGSSALEVNGRVEGDEVSVSAKIAGRVTSMPWREGDKVNKGRLVARISSEQIKAQLDQAEARRKAAQERVQEQSVRIKVLETEVELAHIQVRLVREQSIGRISQASAAYEAAIASLKEKEADLIKAKNDNQRYSALFEEGVVSAQLLDSAKAAYDAALSRKEAAEKQLREAEANLRLARSTTIEIDLKEKALESAKNMLEQAKAALATEQAEAKAAEAAQKEAKATLADTEVHAPLTGTVITKVIEPGEYIVPGTPIIILVDMNELYMKAYISEADIGKIRLGNPARIYVDSFPDRFFSAIVSEISQQAEFTPKTVYIKDERVKLVFGIKLDIADSEGYLKPGMPGDAKVLWESGTTW